MHSELKVKAYEKMHELSISGYKDICIEFLGYEYSESSLDLIYSVQEKNFTLELVNCFNEYVRWLIRIYLWEKVLENYSEDEANILRHEFTFLPLDYGRSLVKKRSLSC